MSLRFGENRPDYDRSGTAVSVDTPPSSRAVGLVPQGPLSPREQEVLRLMSQGLSNREIAASIPLSEDTVKYHLKNLYGKLGASRRTEAVLAATLAGLIEISGANSAMMG